MKKLEIIIQSDKWDRIRKILEKADVIEYYMTDVMKHMKHTGIVKKYRGAEYQVTQIPQIKVETVVTDEVVNSLIREMKEELTMDKMTTMSSEQENDTKIYIFDIQESINL